MLHPNQAAVATALDVDVAAHSSLDEAINSIELKLGENAIEQRALWFVVSVLRHLRKTKWTQLDESGLDEGRRSGLAQDCLAIDGFATSLKTITKDSRSKFRILGFARSKNVGRGVLATGTKAYKIASYVLVEAGLLEHDAGTPSLKAPPKKARPELKEVEKTVVGRRAKRRGYFSDEFMNVADTAKVVSEKNQAVSMSEEEFANLDAALRENETEIVQRSWADQQQEDRWSRILGVIAGIGLFVFVALLFL